jgi:hypothetical protein
MGVKTMMAGLTGYFNTPERNNHSSGGHHAPKSVASNQGQSIAAPLPFRRFQQKPNCERA